MLAVVSSATLSGIEGTPVRVEVHASNGLPGFTIVGMPDAACREARDRVRAALMSSGLTWPIKKVTVNLAPSGIRKTGAALDVAIALGLLCATDQIDPEALRGRSFVGELGLDGAIRPIPGVLPIVASIGEGTIVVPDPCHADAELVAGVDVATAGDLATLVACLRGEEPWPDPPTAIVGAGVPHEVGPDLADVRGQSFGRMAVEVAAAGGHHLLMLGPPGSGKTMLARRISGVLPDLDHEHALEVSLVHSASGLPLPSGSLISRPPVRTPHHGSSAVALVGGGSVSLRPGEVSLAHRGVLFLDELGEFAPHTLEMLREPLEDGVIHVARATASATFPARFLLVAAMNPCPCGEAGRPGVCRCTDRERLRYARRLSGPLLDRFDLRIMVDRAVPEAVVQGESGESTEAVADRVHAARDRTKARGFVTNATIPDHAMDEVAPLTDEAVTLLRGGLATGGISARGVQRIRRVALTLADLQAADPPLDAAQVGAALTLRVEPSRLLAAVGQ